MFSHTHTHTHTHTQRFGSFTNWANCSLTMWLIVHIIYYISQKKTHRTENLWERDQEQSESCQAKFEGLADITCPTCGFRCKATWIVGSQWALCIATVANEMSETSLEQKSVEWPLEQREGGTLSNQNAVPIFEQQDFFYVPLDLILLWSHNDTKYLTKVHYINT